MKKIISILLIFVMLFTAFPVSVYAETSGDYTYSVIYEKDGEKFIKATYKGTERNIVFPSELDGNKVVGVRLAYSAASRVKSIVIPEGVEFVECLADFDTPNYSFPLSVSFPSTLKFIANKTFIGCRFDELVLPEGLQGIAQSAFISCKFNCEVVLPESLNYIDYTAFYKSQLESVYIGENARITAIEYAYPSDVSENDETDSYRQSPFLLTSGLKTITVNNDSPYLAAEGNVLYSKDGKKLYYVGEGHSSFIVPDSVEEISADCFSESEYDSIIVGKNVRKIDWLTFRYVTTIHHMSFADDSRLTDIEKYAFRDKIIGDFIMPKSLKNIEERAFQNAQFESLTFPENSLLQFIGTYAFEKTNLKKFDLSNCHMLSYISEYAFDNCAELEEVNLENTMIQDLRSRTFTNLPNLKKVIVSRYTCGLDDGTFKNCPSLEYVNCDNIIFFTTAAWETGLSVIHYENGESGGTVDIGDVTYNEYCDYYSVKKYNGEDADTLYIPDEINGKPVSVFEYNWIDKKIGKLRIPDGIEYLNSTITESRYIGSLANIPSKLKYIGEDTWLKLNDEHQLNEGLIYIGYNGIDTSELSYLRIPDSLILMERHTVPNNVKSIYIGKSIYSVDELIYNGYITNSDLRVSIPTNHRYENIEVSNANKYYSSKDGVLYNKDQTELICYPADKPGEEFTVPSTVKRIYTSAFCNTKNLKKLIISPSVEVIEDFALYKSSIKDVVIMDNGKLRNLNRAFYGSEIESVYLGSGVRTIAGAFKNLPLKSVAFGDGIQAIGKEAFYGTKLESVFLPDSCNIILNKAFDNCSELSDVYLNNVTSLQYRAFADCVSLESIDLTGVSYKKCDNYNAKDGTFYGCVNLKKFYFTKEEREAYIEEHEFSGNETVESVVIGSSIEEIREAAFENCSNLETAYISPEVKTIAHNAFKGCPKLTIISTLNSPAINYAKANNINYKEQSFIIAPIPDQTYTGRALKPSLIVCQDGFILTADKHYKATYRNNIKVGTATVAVTGLGDYSIFATTARFNIVAPANGEESSTSGGSVSGGSNTADSGTSSDSQKKPAASSSTSGRYSFVTEVARTTIKALKKKRKGFVVKWKRIKKADGYQIQYSKKKGFKKSQLVTVKGRLKSRKTVKKLKRKQRYYVRVRAYRNVNGGKVYSAWSLARKVKTK